MNKLKNLLLYLSLAGIVLGLAAGSINAINPSYSAFKSSLANAGRTLSRPIAWAYNHPVAAGSIALAAGAAYLGYTTTIVSQSAQVANSVVSGLEKSVDFASHHPRVAGSAALTAGAAYLTYCRAHTRKPDFEKVHSITRFMKNPFGMPQNTLKYWRLHTIKGKPAWATAADIMINQKAVYDALKLEKGKIENDFAFIERITLLIEEEKKELREGYLPDLNICLNEYYLIPRNDSRAYLGENMITELVDSYIQADENGATRFIDLSKEQALLLDNEIQEKIATSYLNPFKIARRWALPYEAEALNQYWKIYQLMQRLEALQECLNEKTSELNGGKEAR